MFATLLTAVGLYQAYRLVTSQDGRRVRGAHLLMCLGMAWMLAPVAWPVPRAAGVTVYVAAAIWCLPVRGSAVHRMHAVTGSLAMAYMLAVPGMPMDGMAMSPGGAYAWISLALAAYFLAETAWGGHALLAAGRTRAEGTDGACHMAVGIAMASMLLLMS